MARLYLGIALILVAVGYQYQEEIQKWVLGATKKLQTFQPGDAGQASKEPETLKTEPKDSDSTIAAEKSTDYYNPPFDPNDYTKIYTESGTRMITRNELAAHGHSGPLKPVWLAVMGRVYDVSKGEEHYYGPKGGYNFFSGKDGSRAYVTGEFNEEGLIDDVEGLNPLQLGELDNWVKFYEKDYSFVGKLIGRYYKKDGSPTKAWYKYQKALGEQEKIRAEQKVLEKKFPGCNSKWTQEDGGTVFCSEKR